VIGDLNELAEWGRVLPPLPDGRAARAIHIDTGMNRLGLTLIEATTAIVPRINAGDHGITLVMSHLRLRRNPQSSAQRQAGRDLPRDRQQLFRRTGSRCRILPASISARQFQFDMVRPGGLRFTASIRRRKLTIRCKRGQSKARHRAASQRRARRDSVGYWRNLDGTAADQTWRSSSAGYADGYFRGRQRQ